jgi:glycosyltransferase involved in cell wall biosynthesis
MKSFSVLISVYFKENYKHLNDALLSIVYQTCTPNEIVIVKDGPLSKKLDEVIDKYQRNYSFIKVVELHENKGLGEALNVGLSYCTNDIVARMDADDISEKTRFEKQFSFLNTNPEIAVVGSNLAEFKTVPHDLRRYKKLPEKHEQIVQFSKYRCPINHPTAMFRKSAILNSGNYQKSFPEDYDLWIRVMANGYKFHNIQEPLLYFRRGNMIAKRKGIDYSKKEVDLFYKAYKLHHLNFFELFLNIFIKIPVRLLPTTVLSLLYSNVLRSRSL